MASGDALRRRERGQATTETLLLTWVLIAIIAAMYQLFSINQAIFRSIAAVHASTFARAFERNCYDDRQECTYTTDRAGSSTGARIIWRPPEVPEVVVPVVGMFRDSLPDEFRLWSTRYADGSDDDCPGRPCKRTKMGSGTYEPPFTTLGNALGTFVDGEYYSWYLENLEAILLSLVSS